MHYINSEDWGEIYPILKAHLDIRAGNKKNKDFCRGAPFYHVY
jgi:hypothetical protein